MNQAALARQALKQWLIKIKTLATGAIKSIPLAYQDIVSALLSNDNLLFETLQGNLERKRIIFLNEKVYTFRYSLKDGFFQNGKKLQSTTDVIDQYHIYLHHVVLEEY